MVCCQMSCVGSTALMAKRLNFSYNLKVCLLLDFSHFFNSLFQNEIDEGKKIRGSLDSHFVIPGLLAHALSCSLNLVVLLSQEPLKVSGLPNKIVKISAGYHHSSAISGSYFLLDTLVITV